MSRKRRAYIIYYPKDPANDEVLPNSSSEQQQLWEEQTTLQPQKVISANDGSVSEHAVPVIAPESDDGWLVVVLMSLAALLIFVVCVLFFWICVCFAVILGGAIILRMKN
jgi:uncharacterized membrane protein